MSKLGHIKMIFDKQDFNKVEALKKYMSKRDNVNYTWPELMLKLSEEIVK